MLLHFQFSHHTNEFIAILKFQQNDTQSEKNEKEIRISPLKIRAFSTFLFLEPQACRENLTYFLLWSQIFKMMIEKERETKMNDLFN